MATPNMTIAHYRATLTGENRATYDRLVGKAQSAGDGWGYVALRLYGYAGQHVGNDQLYTALGETARACARFDGALR